MATDPAVLAASGDHYTTIWEDYWLATRRDGQPPLWDVPADLAYLTGLMDAGLPIIDLGCGNGTQTVQLANHFTQVIGADTSSAAIALARHNHPHPHITYVVLNVFDQPAVRGLHDQLGDANVFMRGVLHQIAADQRAAFTTGLRVLLGEHGTLHLVELDAAADEFFTALSTDHGPPPPLAKIFASGIQPGALTPAEVLALLRPDYELISSGKDVVTTTHTLPDGHPAQVPAFHLTARRAH